MRRHVNSTIWFALILFGLVGCTKPYPYGPITALEKVQFTTGDTAYLEIHPPFEGFNGPTALLLGNDNLLYVADTKNNRVVMMDLAGTKLGERQILRPVALGQDFRLDLLIGGLVARANGDTVGAVFRAHLVAASHQFVNAQLDTVWREDSHPARRFVGIGTMPDNTYLLARTGPDNSSFIDPDTRILRFSDQDRFITPVTDLATGTGTGITFINHITSITAFPNSHDFIVLQSSEGVAYGAIWMVYQRSVDFEGWLPKFDPTNVAQGSVDFIRPNRFVNPAGVTVDNRRLDVFIADAAQDTIFKFNSKGAFRRESFGKFATNGRMLCPSGVAFFDKTLYVSDAVANCIFRFKLNSDF
jgi:hypothetical protein